MLVHSPAIASVGTTLCSTCTHTFCRLSVTSHIWVKVIRRAHRSSTLRAIVVLRYPLFHTFATIQCTTTWALYSTWYKIGADKLHQIVINCSCRRCLYLRCLAFGHWIKYIYGAITRNEWILYIYDVCTNKHILVTGKHIWIIAPACVCEEVLWLFAYSMRRRAPLWQ